MREIKRRKLKKIPLADKKKVEEYTGFSQATLRNWRSRGVHLEVFMTLGRKVFINTQAWDRLEIKAVREARKKANKLQEIMG